MSKHVKNMPQSPVTELSRILTHVSHLSLPPVTLDTSNRVQSSLGTSWVPSPLLMMKATQFMSFGGDHHHLTSFPLASTQNEAFQRVNNPSSFSPSPQCRASTSPYPPVSVLMHDSITQGVEDSLSFPHTMIHCESTHSPPSPAVVLKTM